MGSGIAQVAALAGWDVALADIDAGRVGRQIEAIGQQVSKLVAKGKLAPDQKEAALQRISPARGTESFRGCDLIIEAVVEDLEAKLSALAPIAGDAGPETILTTNTSSLSITRIARGVAASLRGEESGAGTGAARVSPPPMPRHATLTTRFVGMHFFNPVPVMPLVEIIAGEDTIAPVVRRAAEIARSWGKTVVHAKDTPGFIVNRVARGYYLESLRMLDEGVAGVDEIDRTLRTLGRFRMGPFELMDLIGIDVNYSVSRSVWEQMGRPARLAPHPIQNRLVEEKHLGRKSGRGFYLYPPGEQAPLPATPVERKSFELPPPVYTAVRRFFESAGRAEEKAAGRVLFGASAGDEGETARRMVGSITEQYIFARVLAAIVNEAALALDSGVATREDIDIAMKLGTNYPRGPLEWAELIGRHTTASLLRAMNGQVDDGRFRPAEWLDS
jgi:3-hydroxybutyryl-CoA dehydrogenase